MAHRAEDENSTKIPMDSGQKYDLFFDDNKEVVSDHADL
jgi:hypothetical protein